MLTRLAACFLSLGLLGSASAHAPVDEVVYVETAPDRVAVKKALEKRRAKNFASFRAYQRAGVYPRNTTRVGPLNVWIDGAGHLCAAATMISKDGKHALVLETGKADNFIRLQNVTSGALLDWMLTSGFTVEEIDQIQLPAVFPDDFNYEREAALLAKKYVAVDAALVKGAKKSLETAVDRLMQNPTLAKRLVAGTI